MTSVGVRRQTLYGNQTGVFHNKNINQYHQISLLHKNGIYKGIQK